MKNSSLVNIRFYVLDGATFKLDISSLNSCIGQWLQSRDF